MNDSEEEEQMEELEELEEMENAETAEDAEQTTHKTTEEKDLQYVNENGEATKEDENVDSEEIVPTVEEVGEPQPKIPENDDKPKIFEKEKQLEIRDIQKNLIEGALYAGGRPLDVEELATKLEIPKKLTETLVNELALEYLERTTSLIIAQVGDRYQMQLRPEYTESVSKFAKGGAIAERYLRTLTVIALKQPILKSVIVKLRGSGAYEHIKYLIDNNLISAVKKGRSFDLTTTDKYSEMFGLPKNKSELKKAMIQQLGVESSDQTPEEPSD